MEDPGCCRDTSRCLARPSGQFIQTQARGRRGPISSTRSWRQCAEPVQLRCARARSQQEPANFHPGKYQKYAPPPPPPSPHFWPRGYPQGSVRHLDASRQKLTPHCLAAIFESQFITLTQIVSQNASQIASPPQARVFFSLSKLPPR